MQGLCRICRGDSIFRFQKEYLDFGKIFRAWRVNVLHLTQYQLAEVLNVDLHSVSHWERNMYYPSVERFCRFLCMCKCYDIRDYFSCNFPNN